MDIDERPLSCRGRSSRTKTVPTLIRLLSDSTLHRAIFESCGVPLAVVDLRNETQPVRLTNSAFQQIVESKSGPVRDRPIADILFEGDSGAARRVLSSLPSRTRVRVPRGGGYAFDLEVSAQPIRDAKGALTHAVLSLSR